MFLTVEMAFLWQFLLTQVLYICALTGFQVRFFELVMKLLIIVQQTQLIYIEDILHKE